MHILSRRTVVALALRNFYDKGKALARAFGDAIRQIGIPVGKVYTSEHNSAYEQPRLRDCGACRLQGHREDGGYHGGRPCRVAE